MHSGLEVSLINNHTVEDLHSQNVAPFVTRKRLPDRAFPGAVLPPRDRWMCCAGFPWAFGLSCDNYVIEKSQEVFELLICKYQMF